jgi:CubicO group peptidase (beta-lactamase class C family)
METMKLKTFAIMLSAIQMVTSQILFAQTEESIFEVRKSKVERLLIEKKVPGIGIGIIEDGVLRKIQVYGNLKTDCPAPYNAVFNVASLSKPISTLLTLRLVSNGDWDLDEPLYHFWIDPDVEDDEFHKKLTTRHVLTHQTGFDNWRRIHESKTLTFNFEPGTKVKYSGEGFEYLRHAIENKFGRPFEDLVKDFIFEPYGMEDSRLLWDEDFHIQRYAEEHDKEGEPYQLVKRTENACASDDVLTTIEDYCLFGMNVMIGSGLSEDVYEDMLRLQAITKPNEGFGLGWYIKRDFYNGEYALMHTGSDAGVAAKVILLPESKRGIVMLTNGDLGFDIINAVEAEYFPEAN